MSIYEEEEEIKPAAIPIKLSSIDGGKGNNWLLGLKEDTVFLAKYPKESDIQLICYRVGHKGNRAVLLYIEGGGKVYVDSVSFSKAMTLIEILEVREE
jgi:hypothetical protein